MSRRCRDAQEHRGKESSRKERGPGEPAGVLTYRTGEVGVGTVARVDGDGKTLAAQKREGARRKLERENPGGVR